MDKSEKFWDMLANKFDKRAKRWEQTATKTIEKTRKYVNTSDIVLDYACATGTITREIAGNVKEIHGIDISSKMIEVAKRKADELEIKNMYFEQSTLFDDKHKKESFDVILVLNILHLLSEDTQKVIQRINELLKPGGLIISATACLKEKIRLLSIMLFVLNKVGIIPCIKFFNMSELENSINNGNFKIIETETICHSPVNYFIVARKMGIPVNQ